MNNTAPNFNFLEYNYEYNFLLNFMNLPLSNQLVLVILYIFKKYCIQYVYELYITYYTNMHSIIMDIRNNDLIYKLLENNIEYKIKTKHTQGIFYKFVNINKLHYLKKYNCYIKHDDNFIYPTYYSISSYNLNDLLKLQELIKTDETKMSSEKTTTFNYYRNIDKNIQPQDNRNWNIKRKDINKLFFEEKDKIISILDNYMKNDKHIGILLIGEPGLGKTTLINAINTYTEHDIFNIKNVSKQDIETLYYKRSGIILYEEFDCKDLNINFTRKIKTYKDLDYTKITKDNIDIITELNEKNKQIEFGEFLECVDGILTKKNISIFTTNNENICLDSALIRPGRIDYIINLKRLRAIDINNYYKQKFNEDIPEKIYKNMNDYIYRLCDINKLLDLDKNIIMKLLNDNNTNIDEYYFNYKFKNSNCIIDDDDESFYECSETNYSEN